MSSPGALVDAILLAALRRLAPDGDPVPLAAVEAEVGALSKGAVLVALRDAG